ncbi:hypothetical protein [Cryptosporangium japonicum]|uniref:Uncharacterized protein n=1 Tax=Cryptosporangium japonicum TaxID=80872 RepID=A0ABN0UXJ9_9ACTN
MNQPIVSADAQRPVISPRAAADAVAGRRAGSALAEILTRHSRHPTIDEPTCTACGVPYPCDERRAIESALSADVDAGQRP